MNKDILEKLALVFSILIIGTAIWFWSGQLSSVFELLEMAVEVAVAKTDE